MEFQCRARTRTTPTGRLAGSSLTAKNLPMTRRTALPFWCHAMALRPPQIPTQGRPSLPMNNRSHLCGLPCSPGNPALIIRNALSDGCQESETGSPLKAANINCSWKCQWRYIIIYESFKWAVNAKTQRMAKNIVKYWQLATAIGPEVSFVATAGRSAMTYGHHSQRVLRFIDQFSFERLQICT